MANPITPVLAAAAGLALGAAIMYALDPDAGRRRRAAVRARATRYRRTALEYGAGPGRLARRLRGRALGLLHRSRAQLRAEAVNDQLLAARVRSRLGHIVARPSAIIVVVDQGEVRLSGAIARDELAALIATVSRIPGVEELTHELELREAAPARTA